MTPKQSLVRQFINRLNHQPSLLKLGVASIVSFLFMGYSNTILEASYAESQFPVPFAEGQTAFDGDLIKSYYQFMLDKGTLDIYVRTQWIDFLFIAAVILTGFFVWTFVARLHQEGSFFRRAGLWMAFALPLAGISDVVENFISFFMLANPLRFSNWIALVYSAVAVLKFAFWTVGIAWLAVSLVTLMGNAVFRLFKKGRVAPSSL